LPLLLLFWHWINPITPKGLLNSERYLIVGAFIAAAVISPSPDALSQTIIAVPIIIVYQFGVIAVLLSIRKARKLQKRAAQEQPMAQLQRAERQPVLAVDPVPEPVFTSQAAAPQRVAAPTPVLSQPQKVRHTVKSIDGMNKPIVHRSFMAVQKPKIAVSPVINTPRSQPPLQVPKRQSLISDFGPIRGYSIDTGR
jgi:sec-independent protein translocase protein TatC